MILTSNYLKERFDYDENKGCLIWKPVEENCYNDKAWNTKYAGKQAGCLHVSGYRVVKLNKKRIVEHRLIWILKIGKLPEKQIDHINGKRNDNRWNNLREATNSENAQNQKRIRNNKSGLLGVSYHNKKKKYFAQIWVNGKNIFLGHYKDSQEAYQAYLCAKEKYHTFNPVPRE